MIYTIILKDYNNSANAISVDNTATASFSVEGESEQQSATGSTDSTQNSISAIISFDCVKSFSESRSATVTNLTVEKGFNISDNMNIEPTQFTLDGVISSYSIIDDTNEIIWDGRKFSTKNSTSAKTYNHARIKQKLIDFFNNRPVFSLLESEYDSNVVNDLNDKYNSLKSGYYKEYENCVITGMDFSVPESSSEAFYISLKIQEIAMAYVESRQMTKEEQSRALTRYTPDPVDKSSSVSGTDSTQGDKSDGEVAGKDGDLAKSIKDIEKENKPKPEDSKYKDGVSFEVGVAPHNEVVRLLESKYDALKNAANAAYTTHKEYEVVPVNGGYKSQPKSGQ